MFARQRYRSGRRNYLLHFKNGRSVPLEVITRLEKAANRRGMSSAALKPSPRETSFVCLPDGTVADLVRDASGNLCFAVAFGGKVSFHRTLKNGPQILIPPRVGPSILASISLPASVGDGCSPATLLNEIDDVIEEYCNVDPPGRRWATYVTLCSWFADLADVVPYLWVVGQSLHARTTLLRLLSVLVRRGIYVSDISCAGLHSVIDKLRPTVLLDDFDDRASSRIQRLLRNGNRVESKVYLATGPRPVFGPKIFSSPLAPSNASLKSQSLVVVSQPRCKTSKVLSSGALEKIQQRFQPRLLAFRIQNYLRVMREHSRTPGLVLTPETEDFFRALALPLMGDAQLELELLGFLAPHDKEVACDLHSQPKHFVMVALFAKVHSLHAGRNRVSCGDLAILTEKLLQQAAEPYSLDSREVGDHIRALGLETESIGNRGRGLNISKSLVVAVHAKAKDHGICVGDLREPGTPELISSATHCRLCHEFGLLVDNSGKELPYIEGETVIPVPQDIDPFEEPDDPEWNFK